MDIRTRISKQSNYLQMQLIYLMKKYILSSYLIVFIFTIRAEAQHRTILFKNDSLTFIHDTYGLKATFYVIDNFSNKIDTLGKPNGFPVGELFYNGKYFSVMYQHRDRFTSIVYSLFTKINGKWKIVSFYTGSLDQPKNAIYKLEQADIFTLNESLSGFYPEDMISELKADTDKRAIVRYKISTDRAKETVEEYPFQFQY